MELSTSKAGQIRFKYPSPWFILWWIVPNGFKACNNPGNVLWGSFLFANGIPDGLNGSVVVRIPSWVFLCKGFIHVVQYVLSKSIPQCRMDGSSWMLALCWSRLVPLIFVLSQCALVRIIVVIWWNRYAPLRVLSLLSCCSLKVTYGSGVHVQNVVHFIAQICNGSSVAVITWSLLSSLGIHRRILWVVTFLFSSFTFAFTVLASTILSTMLIICWRGWHVRWHVRWRWCSCFGWCRCG